MPGTTAGEAEAAKQAVTEAVKQGRLHRFDTRAVLALIAVIGSFIYQGAMLWFFRSEGTAVTDLQIPAWMSAMAAAIVGYYFGAKANATNGG